MVLPVVPRVSLLAFTLCQPLLLKRLLGFLTSPKQDKNIGYGLIGAYGVVYLGIAVSYPNHGTRKAAETQRYLLLYIGIVTTDFWSCYEVL
jgi:hypothetical protein